MMDGNENDLTENAGKGKFQPPPRRFWHRNEKPSLTIRLADLTPREWSIIVNFITLFLLLIVIENVLLIYGVRAVTEAEMDKGFLQSGYVRADEIISQGGFVYNGEIFAIGKSSIMTIPEKVQSDLQEVIKMNERLRKRKAELEGDLEYERNRRPVVPPPRLLE